MPIQSDDIKLLQSAVMADVPEGGGGATGIDIIDGQSNNIFPDTSTDDRAGGRFQLRKIFGAGAVLAGQPSRAACSCVRRLRPTLARPDPAHACRLRGVLRWGQPLIAHY